MKKLILIATVAAHLVLLAGSSLWAGEGTGHQRSLDLLRIIFPDGDYWVVDAKNSRLPRYLETKSVHCLVLANFRIVPFDRHLKGMGPIASRRIFAVVFIR